MADDLRSCARCGISLEKTLAELAEQDTQCLNCRAINYVRIIKDVPTQLAAVARVVINMPKPPDNAPPQ